MSEEPNNNGSGGAWLLAGLAAFLFVPVEWYIPPTSIDAAIDRAADRKGLPRPLLHALVQIESGKRVDAISPKGATGLSQVMPFNARRCGLSHAEYLKHPILNLECGAQILREELDTYKGDVTKALQSYNGGPKCLGKCRESVEYAKKVLALAGKG